jgi:transposase
MSTEVANELIALRELVGSLRQENTLLRQKIDLLIKRVFGSSSEKLDRSQLELLLQLSEQTSAREVDPVAPAPVRTSMPVRKQKSPRLPENLPVIEEVIDPEPVKAQPENFRCIGQEVSEQLDYEPGHFLRRRTIRRKYVHRTEVDAVPVIAPLPECLQERGLAAPGLLAHVVVSKYCDHLPLYRQEQIFAQRYKINLPRQTLARWVELAADWLRPIYEEIRTGVMGGGYVQIDETPIEYLEPGHGSTRQGYLWTCHRPGGDVFYSWQTSRAAECLQHVVPTNFRGTVQCDGYAAYRSFAHSREGIELAGCWAHVRRKFYEAMEQSPRAAGWFMRQIQQLYTVESALRESAASVAQRLAARSAVSQSVLTRIERALIRLKASRRYLPQSLLGVAMDYALSQWTTLIVYLSDGRLEIDNNLVENAIRPTAIGKKNWLFVGEAGAGQRTAIIYTLIESCRKRGINPLAYLRDVLTRLPHSANRQVSQLRPAQWNKPRKTLPEKMPS